MRIILTPAEGLGVDDDLMLAIDKRLTVITLDDAMGCLHLSRLVIREVTADLFARGSVLGLIYFQPFLDPLRLLL
jgi:hypothetical protein